MHWKRKRTIGTALSALAPYVAFTFIALDPTAAFASDGARAIFLLLTTFAVVAAFTYPGWSWE